MAQLRMLFVALLMIHASQGVSFLACPEGYALVGLQCYHVSPDAHNGTAAQQYCQGKGGVAAVVESQQEMDLLKEFVLTTTVHLGVNLQSHREEIFKFALKLSGFSGYTSFGRSEPNNYGGEDCVLAEQSLGFDWKDARCDETHPVLCSTPPLVQDKMFCQDDAFKYDDKSCIWVHKTFDYDWYEARVLCQSRGGDLASIHSHDENAFIAGLITTGSWTGMNDIEAETHYEWSDRTPLDYTYWNPENPEPDNTTSQNCIRMFAESGFWYDWDCEEASGVVCKEPTF